MSKANKVYHFGKMGKKIIFFIIFLLIIPVIYAPSKKNVELFVNDKVTVGGKTITFLSLTSSKILLEIDGSKKIISSSDLTRVDGITFTIEETVLDEEIKNVYVKLNISMTYTCGDEKCDLIENERICCKDCGCSDNETEACVSNQCIQIDCRTDEECDDNNTCTIDKCQDYLCTNELITTCKKNDGCCPANCTYSNDNDCKSLKVCEENEVEGNMYCQNNRWNSKKQSGNLCTKNYECLSSLCKDNKCSEIEITEQDPLLPSPERKTVFQIILDFIIKLFS